MEIAKIKTNFEVKNDANSDSVDMYLYGTIRQAYWWDDEEDCISAKRVKVSLSEVKGKRVNVHINSGGGDVFEAIAIQNLLKQHGCEVYIYIDALAGSGASIIAMAGDKVFMPQNAMIMIHKAWTLASGNSDDLRKVANDLDKIDESVKASYKNRFVGTDEELSKLIADESWLTAEECLAFGFCDEILEEKKEKEKEKEEVENKVKESLFNKYKKNIVAKVDDEAEPKRPALFNAFKQNLGGK